MVTAGQVIFIGAFLMIVTIIFGTVVVALARTMKTLKKGQQYDIIEELK